jgi:hypothetical protein
MNKYSIDEANALIVELHNLNYFFGCDDVQESREKTKIKDWLIKGFIPTEIRKDIENTLRRKI